MHYHHPYNQRLRESVGYNAVAMTRFCHQLRAATGDHAWRADLREGTLKCGPVKLAQRDAIVRDLDHLNTELAANTLPTLDAPSFTDKVHDMVLIEIALPVKTQIGLLNEHPEVFVRSKADKMGTYERALDSATLPKDGPGRRGHAATIEAMRERAILGGRG